jgi:hypothetical protein
MSNTTKIVTAVIVVIIIAGGGYYWYTHMPSEMGMASSADQNGTASGTAAAVASLPGGSSDSDAALNSDTAAIDSQMSGLSSDNTNVSSSINDQPVSQQ